MTFRLPCLTGGLLALACLVASDVAAQDLFIRDALVYDGTGAPARVADVRVEAGRIVAVGELTPADDDEIREAEGLALAPGFIILNRR